jgi:hypothetical protein
MAIHAQQFKVGEEVGFPDLYEIGEPPEDPVPETPAARKPGRPRKNA